MPDQLQDIPDYEGLYVITADGRVWSCPRQKRSRRQTTGGKFLKPFVGRRYLRVNLYKDGVVKQWSIHQLVLLAWHGPRPSPYHEAAHNNGDHLDNRIENLRWATCAANHQDQEIHGVRRKGSNHGMSKLTEQSIAKIWRLRNLYSQYELADQFGVSQGTIWGILHDRTWRHVTRLNRNDL